VGPAGVPVPVVKKLNEEFIRAAHSEAVTHMLVSQATEVFTGTPQEFSALMARDIVRLGKVVRELGAKGSKV
jgi:tripartite-type tricarboxylate transporter receptor subunit TctC